MFFRFLPLILIGAFGAFAFIFSSCELPYGQTDYLSLVNDAGGGRDQDTIDKLREDLRELRKSSRDDDDYEDLEDEIEDLEDELEDLRDDLDDTPNSQLAEKVNSLQTRLNRIYETEEIDVSHLLEHSVRIDMRFYSRPLQGCAKLCDGNPYCPEGYCFEHQSYAACSGNFCSRLPASERSQCRNDCDNDDITGEGGKLSSGSLGSGFFVGDDEVLTNYHVIRYLFEDDRSRSDIHTYSYVQNPQLIFYERPSDDGDPFIGQVKWFDKDNDLALIERLSSSPSFNGESVTFGSFNNLKLLDLLISIGSPGGVDFTASLGYLTNKSGTRCDYCFFYSVPTSGGASGSPIYNRNYELVGIHHSSDYRTFTRNGNNYALGADSLRQGTNVNRIQDLLNASYPNKINLDVTGCTSSQLQDDNLDSCIKEVRSSVIHQPLSSVPQALSERESERSARFSLENSRLEIRGEELRR